MKIRIPASPEHKRTRNLFNTCMRPAFLLYLCILLTVAGCRTYQTPAEYKGTRVAFGMGGGITGQWEQYVLLPNGQLFFYSSYDTTGLKQRNIPKKEAKEYFRELKKMDLKPFQQPGNMSRYVAYMTQRDTIIMQWGAPRFTPPDEIKDLHAKLMKSALSVYSENR